MSISVSGVSYTYSPGTFFEMPALQDISLTIEDGEYVGIMGQTGCGKSTLIQLMVGLMPPSAGQILLDGKDIHQSGYLREELRRKVGLVFQYPEVQLFETTVEKDVAFGLKHSGLSKAAVAENVRWAIETVGLNDRGWTETYPRTEDMRLTERLTRTGYGGSAGERDRTPSGRRSACSAA